MIDMQDQSYNRPTTYQNKKGIALAYKVKGKKRVWAWFPDDVEYGWWQYGAFERPPSDYTEETMTLKEAEQFMISMDNN